ncbi:unknown [Bacteroides sp. CAG:1060]|nr:unknown [Bacteroides sp. CAG:1060]
MKYREASFLIDSSPPSQTGRPELTATPIAARNMLNISVEVMACFKIILALYQSLEPILWAT